MGRVIASGEVADVSGVVGLADANGGVIPSGARWAMVQAITKSVRWRKDGVDPAADEGFLLLADHPPLVLHGGLSQYKFIEAEASASLFVTFLGNKILRVVTEPAVWPPNGEVGEPYELQFETELHVGQVRFSVSDPDTLPPGLTLSESGLLSGTPTTDDTYDFTVIATDQAGNTGSANITHVIDPAA